MASFVFWFPAALLPSRIWPRRPERLAVIAQRRGTWQVLDISLGGAAPLLVLGFAALAEPLERAGGSVLVSLSLTALLVSVPLWALLVD